MPARVLAAIVLELVPADQPVVLSVDDTTARHKGDHVYGKGCHRDTPYTARWGIEVTF